MKAIICLVLALAVSTSLAAPRKARHHHVAIKPDVTFEELLAASLQAADTIETALRDAAKELEAAVGGAESDAAAALKEILAGAETEATAIVRDAIVNIQSSQTVEEAAGHVKNAVHKLADLGQRTAEAIKEVAKNLSPEVQQEVTDILTRLEGKLKAAVEPVVKLIEEALAESGRSTKVSLDELLQAGIAAALKLEQVLKKAVNEIDAALEGEDEVIAAKIQEIIAKAKEQVEEKSAAAIAELEQAQTDEEAVQIIQQFVNDLKALGYETKAQIEATLQGLSQGAQESIQTTLNNLVEEIKVTLQPLQDLLDQAAGGGR